MGFAFNNLKWRMSILQILPGAIKLDCCTASKTKRCIFL